jgi:hypothetical protein
LAPRQVRCAHPSFLANEHAKRGVARHPAFLYIYNLPFGDTLMIHRENSRKYNFEKDSPDPITQRSQDRRRKQGYSNVYIPEEFEAFEVYRV